MSLSPNIFRFSLNHSLFLNFLFKSNFLFFVLVSGKISLLNYYILAFLAGIIFSANFYELDAATKITNLGNALLIVFDKISFPIHFIVPFLAGKNVYNFFIFNLWFSFLLFSKISLQIHIIPAILADITFFYSNLHVYSN